MSQRVKTDLTDSGLVANEEKCQWEPCQVLEWLGLEWNSITGTIRITEKRLLSIHESANRIFQKRFFVSARELASFVGKIISAGAVFGNIARLMTRYCSISIAAAPDWDSVSPLDEYCQRELTFWKEKATRLNIKHVDTGETKKSNYIIYSDASGTGCGAHLDCNGEQICHRQWSVEENLKSSTWRELTAIQFALESFLPMLKGTYVKWFSDSRRLAKLSPQGV